MVRKIAAAIAAFGLLIPVGAAAHHSFAVFFDSNKLVRIKGKVRVFRYANPHGTIIVTVQTRGGEARDWQIETNAPVMLTRRGWDRNTLKAGDEVTVEGWLARDGSRYLRLRQIFDGKGKLIGTRPFEQED